MNHQRAGAAAIGLLMGLVMQPLAHAQFAGGTGTSVDPFQVSDVDQLQAVGTQPAAHYRLIADIEASVTASWNEGAGFVPIGTDVTPFSGSFDGNGHVIRDLVVNRPNQNFAGVFGVSSGDIEGLGVLDASVTGFDYVGAVVGYLMGAGTVVETFSTGSVSGNARIGGLAGQIDGALTFSYSLSEVVASNNAGGLVGVLTGSIGQSYAAGRVSGGSNTGGLAGSSSGTLAESYWNISSSKRQSSLGGGVGLSDKQFRTFDSFGWGAHASVWETDQEVSSYPRLVRFASSFTPSIDPPFDAGTGTEADPYRVSDIDMLQELVWYYDGIAEQTADIDATGFDFQPIGSATRPFSGSFDGAGFVIRHLAIEQASTDGVGLFGVISGSVDRVGLMDVAITGRNRTGAIAGDLLAGGEIRRTYVAAGTVTGNQQVGGFVGANNGVIVNSYALTAVNGGSTRGGFVGINNSGATITGAYAAGPVASGSFTGGFAGSSSGTLSGVYWNTTTTTRPTSSGGGTPLSNSRALFPDDYTDLDLAFWMQATGTQASYPYLKDNPQTPPPGLTDIPFTTGKGTTEDPFLVETLDQLDDVRFFKDAAFKLAAILDARPTAAMNDGAGWDPIGTPADPFTGRFDGNRLRITGLTVNRPAEEFNGLFGVVSGIVTDLAIEEADITGGNYTGVLVGRIAVSGSVTRVYTTGTIIGAQFTGGVAGEHLGSIQDAYSMAAVTGSSAVGGLTGRSPSGASIQGSYAAGPVTGTSSTGGLNGSGSSATVTSSYYNSTTTGRSGSVGGTALTDAVFRSQGSFTGFDFNTIWDIRATSTETSYPFLKLMPQDPPPGFLSNPFTNGSGTPEDPYHIASIGQFQAVRSFPGGHFTVVADIDGTGTAAWNNGAGWEPIGSVQTPFSGTVDGNGHTVTGLTINRPDQDRVGVFGHVTGVLSRLVFDESTVTGRDHTGGLAGYLAAGGRIEESAVSGTVTGDEWTGGLVGWNQGTVADSYSLAAVTGNHVVGGLAGWLDTGGRIESSHSAGLVSGPSATGGLTGVNVSGTVVNSYWNVSSSGQTGSAGGTALMGGQFRRMGSFGGFDFIETWEIVTGESLSFPFLRSQGSADAPGLMANPFPANAGTVGDPFPVATADALQLMAEYPDAHFTLTQDIDASATMDWNGGRGFIPAGNAAVVFSGGLDGNGFGIFGVNIHRPEASGVGLFGLLNGSVSNVRMTGVRISGGDRTGGLAGETGPDATVDRVSVTGSVTGRDEVGGLVGRSNGSITRSYSTGAVNGRTWVGGLVALNFGRADRVYTTARATGSVSAGAMVASNVADAELSNCYAVRQDPEVPPSKRLETASLEFLLEAEGVIRTCFFLLQVDAVLSPIAGVSFIPPGSRRLAASFPGFDFDADWAIQEGVSYPFLRDHPQTPAPGSPEDVSVNGTDLPGETLLHPNFPNPFNPSTVIGFQLSGDHIGSPVRLAVFDVLGREVAVLADGVMPAGAHQVVFDASGLASGMYLYRLSAGGQVTTRRMMLVK